MGGGSGWGGRSLAHIIPDKLMFTTKKIKHILQPKSIDIFLISP